MAERLSQHQPNKPETKERADVVYSRNGRDERILKTQHTSVHRPLDSDAGQSDRFDRNLKSKYGVPRNTIVINHQQLKSGTTKFHLPKNKIPCKRTTMFPHVLKTTLGDVSASQSDS